MNDEQLTEYPNAFDIRIDEESSLATIRLNGQIGFPRDAYNDSTSYSDIVRDLSKAREKDIRNADIYINSIGGNLIDGMGVINEIRNAFTGDINTYVVGAAFSIGAAFMKIGIANVYPTSLIMLHAPQCGFAEYGSRNFVTSSFESYLAKLIASEKSYLTLFEGVDDAKLIQMGKPTIKEAILNDKELWLTGQEAYDAGLVDNIIDNTPLPATELSGISACYGSNCYIENIRARDIPAEFKGAVQPFPDQSTEKESYMTTNVISPEILKKATEAGAESQRVLIKEAMALHGAPDCMTAVLEAVLSPNVSMVDVANVVNANLHQQNESLKAKIADLEKLKTQTSDSTANQQLENMRKSMARDVESLPDVIEQNMGNSGKTHTSILAAWQSLTSEQKVEAGYGGESDVAKLDSIFPSGSLDRQSQIENILSYK